MTLPSFSLSDAQIAVGILVSIVGVLGTVFGWFGRAFRWLGNLAGKKPAQTGTIPIPKRTVIVQAGHRHAPFWWHMGSMSGAPAMQIVAHLSATNVSQYDVLLVAAQLRHGRLLRKTVSGAAATQAHDRVMYGRFSIPVRHISEVSCDFWIQPPCRVKTKPFRADIALIDQFGNKHWVKGVTFAYT
ncbi:hypothetical protein [Cupriavidus sp. IK-TO18]|uniref:hypothetical protein n=1 Tax=Cupriavidus sp. IK-TO18 TaxID=2782182 RepID=UPI001899CA37|nr:hypothetical protein [Cupriavidus sp. IK-TO18]MBF6987270.1 hypothetical protein [Cupriavidus sp. IK-TO18]